MRSPSGTLYCSNCGEPLGAVAHILNNELLCENCYLKATPGSDLTSHTVAFGVGDDEQRRAASGAIEAAEQPAPAAGREEGPPGKPDDERSIIARFLFPGEALLWRRSFSKGLINRHLTYTEFVSNQKALCIDDEHGAAIRCALLRDSQLAVTRERRQYSGTRSGYESHGAFVGASSGGSVAYGDVEFVVKGRIALTLFNVRDPQGLKRLVEASVRSSAGSPFAHPR